MVDKLYKSAYLEWVGKSGLIECPRCHSNDVVHITLPYEGEMLICNSCKNNVKIGEEDKKNIRRGWKI